MSTDFKTSLLVNKQVPEFIREEYPKFITFLEAYYEFLEQKQSNELNDLITQAKNLRYISDIDTSITDFEQNFINTFASSIPHDISVDKDFLIKNVLPLYLSKGSQKSFEFLFQLLYGENVDITFPKDNILRASDGKWVVENVLRINKNVYSYYVADGIKNVFFLVQQVEPNEIEVYINDVQQFSNFYIQKEYKKIVFNFVPANNSKIKIVYKKFNENIFNNRKITGLTSGATALVEKAAPRLITQQASIELYIHDSSTLGTFLNSETISADIIFDDGISLINIRSDTKSSLTSIEVTNGGTNYNIGDPVLIIGGAPKIPAEAIVETVSSGLIDAANVYYGGAGFAFGGIISGTNYQGSVILGASLIDTSGDHTPNTYEIFTDTIENFSNVTLSSSDYGFLSNAIPAGENISTRIVDALSTVTIYDIGVLLNVNIIFCDTTPENLTIVTEGAKYANTIDIKTFGSIGRIDIISGGNNYTIGDEITFGVNPTDTYGVGAAAIVSNVSSSGSITRIEIQPTRISGNANTMSGNIMVVGTGTDFLNELIVGDRIIINSEVRYVNSISSATSLNVNTAFTRTSTGRKLGVYNRYPVGGQGYTQNNFPIVTASSKTGSDANLKITSIMGDGVELGFNNLSEFGQIQKIKITNAGEGYQFTPTIDLTGHGDGSATANSKIERSKVSFPGKWLGSDGIISSYDRRLEGLDYYIDFTYLTTVAVEFSKYAEILKNLLHPAGFKNYAQYPINKFIDLNLDIDSTLQKSISGLVSTTNGSITVTGTSTKFNIANSLNIITIGSTISINNEKRIVNSIISNTSLTVSVPFTNNSSAQTLIILV